MVIIKRYLSRKLNLLLIILTLTCMTYYFYSSPHFTSAPELASRPPSKYADPGQFQWRIRKEKYPVQSMIQLPNGKPAKIPKIQRQILRHPTSAEQKATDDRRDAIKATFSRGWTAYRKHAWKKDELMPIGGDFRNFGNWAATLVDSLGTLLIMGMKEEFEEAITALETIDFSRNDKNELNIFDITVRYLGGLLSAYDLSNKEYPVLLEKALDLGDMIYAAFDTPNRLPITRWHWKGYCSCCLL
jgi:mannosyl-oligosaccharide alpha-1,2-mannosidase